MQAKMVHEAAVMIKPAGKGLVARRRKQSTTSCSRKFSRKFSGKSVKNQRHTPALSGGLYVL